jgi:hypothetical protein
VTGRRIATIFAAALAVLAVAIFPSAAFANFGPHGGYIADTDACAWCHRAHTAPSSITWTSSVGTTGSALLLTGSDQVYEFCLTCHDSTAQGADTNVLGGVYEGTSSTNGTPGGELLSGAFGQVNASGVLVDAKGDKVTSTHVMNGTSVGAWGGGAYGSTSSVLATGGTTGTGSPIVMDCGTCHDPHGSSNYRLLKDLVYGVAVGGYDPTAPGATATSPTPTPFVISDEAGYPAGGFALHTEYPDYTPNYTTAQYAQAPGGDAKKGMSGWCAGCHTAYASVDSTYNAGDGSGALERHRHAVNVPLSTFTGPLSITATEVTLPLDHPVSEQGSVHNTQGDWIECLTCHNSHGASTIMTGFANVADPVNNPVPDSGTGGLPPTNDSALLKLNSRGVCEDCHAQK